MSSIGEVGTASKVDVRAASHHPTKSDYCYFRPQLFYQNVAEWHTCEAALEFKMNLSSAVNQARFPSSITLEDGDPERLQDAKEAATKLVPEDQTKNDRALVVDKLLAAATWCL